MGMEVNNLNALSSNLVIDERGIIRHISLGAAIEGNNEMLLHDLRDAVERLKRSGHRQLE